MLIAVAGGTGTLGALTVDELIGHGHEVRVLARHAEHRVDLATGEGLDKALDGVEAVVDASNASGRKATVASVLVDGTRRLLVAEHRAGVGHHVLVSIVGIDDVPIAYYEAKVAQEHAVREGGVPWSIIRATQFHTLVDHVFHATARFGVLPRAAVPLQPIDPREVARALADAVAAGPSYRRRDVAGPEIRSITELARTWMHATGHRRVLAPLPAFGATGRSLRSGALTAPDAATPTTTFAAWLHAR